ncbi:glycosyltransferase family 4 protein [Aeromonas dhakensis]|uniref:glycosyltransferase family 4 protein n=1 Tax=Aeromonas dhakensis TaxID=196024 RepID=UPI00398708BE
MSLYSIDVRWMVGSFRGMGRYAWQLIEPIKHKAVALAPKGTQKVPLKSDYAGSAFFPYWEQFIQPGLAKKAQVSYLICPYNTGPLWVPKGIKTVLVVHDLIFMKSFKELPFSVSLYQVLGRLYRRFVVPRLIKKADYIITVSHYTKGEILKHYSPKAEIEVIPNAISSKWLNHIVQPLSQRSNYFITVAGEAPSKNLNRLLAAYANYVKQVQYPTPLKIVGVKSSYHKQFQLLANKFEVGSYIEWIGYISNEELISLYSNAKGFIFASLFEGFGIPLIEAMAVGTPISCSNTTSLPEVVGDCAYQFSPLSIEEISSGFLHLDQDKAVLRSDVLSALDRVKKYSEKEVNKQFVLFWNKIDAK